MGRYHEALKKDMRRYAQSFDCKLQLDTIYMGGGTPSTYPQELLLDMFGTLEEVFSVMPDAEISMEVNPGTVKDNLIETWKRVGINRLSVGVQSLNEAVLKNLNRHHSARDVYELLRRVGGTFNAVSVDLILGLPGVSEDEWKALIAEVVTWPIQHVSMYFLEVHENTPLFVRLKTKRLKLSSSDHQLADLYCWSVDTLRDHGFMQYEVSSFAREGYQSRHNSTYWHRKPYQGFGVGAWSFDGEKRFTNEKDLMRYMDGIEAGKDVVTFSETPTKEQAHREHVMLGLRRVDGIERELVCKGMNTHEREKVGRTISSLKERALITEENGRLKLTPAGLAIEHEIAVALS